MVLEPLLEALERLLKIVCDRQAYGLYVSGGGNRDGDLLSRRLEQLSDAIEIRLRAEDQRYHEIQEDNVQLQLDNRRKSEWLQAAEDLLQEAQAENENLLRGENKGSWKSGVDGPALIRKLEEAEKAVVSLQKQLKKEKDRHKEGTMPGAGNSVTQGELVGKLVSYFVPPFSGGEADTTIAFDRFLTGCENVQAQVLHPDDQITLVRAIQVKLSGEAYRVVNGLDLKEVKDMLDRL